ncbi:MAG: DNA translocase FtsK 4TM domain-containing protein, partial [Endomicrobium sp.]|nr:DNA translocase FtsK 4TM domain-containing protein [Endomicrobium sp.]
MEKKRIIKNKNRIHNGEKINREAVALFFILAAFLSAYAFIVPYRSGIVGKAFYCVMFNVFGASAYILPFIFLWQFILHIRQSVELKGRLDFIWSFLCMICASVFFEAVHFMFEAKVKGGWIGNALYPFLKELLDAWLGLVLITVFTLILFSKILRLSIVRILLNFLGGLKKDLSKLNNEKNDLQKPGGQLFQQSFPEDIFTRGPAKPNIVNRFDEEEKKKEE